MKKYIIYAGLFILGLLLGWLLFGGQSNNQGGQNQAEATNINQMWTCSMDPQIMKTEPGDCPICGMELIPSETSSDGLLADQFKMTENAMALANIETTAVVTKNGSKSEMLLSGKIQANDKSSAVQTAHFGGRIESLYFKSEGELVRNGAVIASIYSPELVTAQNELIEAMNIKNEQPELYKAVRNKLKFWKIFEQQIQQIERTKKVITNFKMYANTNGYIETVFVKEGNHVKEGDPLFKVANLNSVWAELEAYEQDVKFLSLGQTIDIGLNAFPGETISAKIDYISPVLNNNTRTVSVRATLNNFDKKLKPGMLISANAQLKNNQNENLVSIPKTAVLWTGKRSVVYVKVPNDLPVFELREIQLGNDIGENYMVLAGLENGEEIVTNGTFTVDAAAQLQGKKSMMNNQTKTNNVKSSKLERLIVPEAFQNQLKAVVDGYVLLKNDLVNDNASSGIDFTKDMLVNLEKVDMSLLENNNAHRQWMSIHKDIKTSANALLKEKEITSQRKYFKPLSFSLTKAVEIFGINQTVYSQFCPMADADKGAFWLSFSNEIQNPYFGEAMLSCGSVEQVID